MSHRPGEHPAKSCSPCLFGHPHSLQTCAKFCLRAVGPYSIPPALSSPGRGPSVRKPDWVAGPTSALAVARARPLGPRLLAVEATPAVLPEDSLKGPGEARGRGARADSVVEAHPHPLLTAAAPASPARPRAVSLGRPGGVHPEGEETPLVLGAGRPTSRPRQQPRSARASHSPTRRRRAFTAGAGTTTAASSGPRPGPAHAPGPAPS